MVDEDKVKAVTGYLRAEFSECEIDTGYDPGHRAHNFRILTEKSVYQAQIGDDFLNDHDASQIPAKLRRFTLAEHLRELPSDIVVVTQAGLRLLGD